MFFCSKIISSYGQNGLLSNSSISSIGLIIIIQILKNARNILFGSFHLRDYSNNLHHGFTCDLSKKSIILFNPRFLICMNPPSPFSWEYWPHFLPNMYTINHSGSQNRDIILKRTIFRFDSPTYYLLSGL